MDNFSQELPKIIPPCLRKMGGQKKMKIKLREKGSSVFFGLCIAFQVF